jgi:NAD(P)-dependent dehydrogenase (short-subunit alcohol dehydrogenase family)
MSNAKIAVITGTSRGLGLALAQEFVANGWKVFGTGRSERPAELADGVEYRQFDASNADECESFWRQLHADNPDAEICLVNNAGSYLAADGGLAEAKPEDFERQMRSIYFTSVYMTHALAKHIASARIVNVISSSALLRDPSELAYGSAKDAQRHFFQSLQEFYKPGQYQITNLYPDYIASHGPNPKAMAAEDLSSFIREIAEAKKSFCLRDVTMYPRQV